MRYVYRNSLQCWRLFCIFSHCKRHTYHWKADQMSESSIEYGKGGTSFVGRDAVNCFQAFALAGYLDLYAKHGIRPTRSVGQSQLLAMATSYTKKG